jgi:hypothetical protein
LKTPDFNDFKVKDSKEAAHRDAPKVIPSANRWWVSPVEQLPFAIMSQVAAIIKSDRGRIDSYNTYAKLYGTYTPSFWNGYQLSNTGRPSSPQRDRLTYNIIQSCIDTVTAMIISNKPKPMFLTSDGDSKTQRRAKKLDAFCYGTYYENDIYALGPKVFRDACVFGEGIIHCYSDNGKIRYERVLPYEILVDYLESHYGPESTKSMHRIKNIDRTELASMYPDHAKDIAAMTGTSMFISAQNRSVSDTVTVVESWRLPTGNAPGLHVITTENTVLFKENYLESFFPFAIMRYSPRLYGFYGQGMAEQLVPIQVELNRTLISIQRSLYLGGTHKIFVHTGSKVIKSHFDNAIGTILSWAGQVEPKYIVPQLVQPEIYAHLESIKQMGYQLPGVSQMNATSVKTPGVNSGRAMRTEQNINTQRHQTIEQGYNQFLAVDLTKITVAVARKAYKDGFKPTAKVPGKRFIQKIDWKDVNMEDDEFVLQIYPVSKLPQDPEGRLSSIQEMMQSGLLTPDGGRRLLDYPDLDAEEGLANAMLDYLHKILDDIVDNGKYKAPEPTDDLLTAQKLCLEYIVRGKLNNLDDKRLNLLRKFIKQIQNLMTPPAPAAPPPGGPPGGPPVVPQANPTPTPTSDLIPNVNTATPQAA